MGDIAKAQRSLMSCSFINSLEQTHVYMFNLKLLSYGIFKAIPVNEQKQRRQAQTFGDITVCSRESVRDILNI